MKISKLMAGLICSIIIFSTSKALAGGYIGVSGNYIDTDITDHTGTTVTGGYNFNDFLAIEGRYLVHSSDEGYHGVNIELESVYGVYILGTLPITDSFGVYALFGHTSGKAKASYDGNSASASDSGSSVGFGVKYELTENWTVNAEYAEMLDDIDQMSIGLKLNF